MEAAQQEARIRAGSLDFYRVCLPAVPILIMGFLCLEGKEVQHLALAQGNMPRTSSDSSFAVQQTIPAAAHEDPVLLYPIAEGHASFCGDASGTVAR